MLSSAVTPASVEAARVRITVTFACEASPAAILAAAQEIAVAISSLSAGATFEPTMGVWDCNGALDQERYGGPVAVEAGARVIAVVPAARADALMAALRPAVEEGCRDLRVNWVDVLRETGGLTAAHFRIDAAG